MNKKRKLLLYLESWSVPMLALVLFIIASILPGHASASLIVTFDTGDSFSGAGPGDTSDLFTDPDTGNSVALTTRSVGPDGTLNPNSGALGINASTGDAAFFNLGESWTFDMNADTLWEGIKFTFFNQSETFTVTSADFVGLSLTPPDPSEVSYNSAQGSFTFNTSGGDTFTFSDLGATSGLALSAGSDFQISFGDSGTRSGSAKLDQLTFAVGSPIPEPSSIILLISLFSCVLFQMRKRIKTVAETADS